MQAEEEEEKGCCAKLMEGVAWSLTMVLVGILYINCNIWMAISIVIGLIVKQCCGSERSGNIVKSTIFAMGPLITSIWVVSIIRIYYISIGFLAFEVAYITWAVFVFIYMMIQNVHPWVSYPDNEEERKEWKNYIASLALLPFDINARHCRWEAALWVPVLVNILPALITGFFVHSYFVDPTYKLECDETYGPESGL